MNNELWDKEEFEDIIVRSFIGLYETENITKKKFKRHPSTNVTRQDIDFARDIGCYFPPNDRIVHFDTIDIQNDGLPGCASYTQYDFRQASDEDLRDFITFFFAKKIKRLPGGFKTNGHKAYYECITWAPQTKGGAHMVKDFFGIRPDGSASYANGPNMTIFEKDFYLKKQFMLLATLQFYQDRRHLWNVMATESEAKGTFGVYEEQIKSLFYARSLPVTGTGRKRPILHWVNAHMRRIKNGVDIDISKHLRGVISFEMNGTRFDITQPIKNSSL